MTGDANAISVIAYLDESKKPMRNSSTGKVSDSGEHYVVAAAVLMRGDQQVLRQRLHGVDEAVFETRATLSRGLHALDEHDHATWYSLVERGLVDSRLTIRYENKSEPLLWLADALAGSRTDYLCGVDRGVFPLLAHRVTIRRVAGLR